MNEKTSESASALESIREAQSLYKKDRKRGWSELNRIFRAGKPPEPPLEGPCKGELIAVKMAPGVTQLVEFLTSFWMPWLGKRMFPDEARGDNIFGKKSRWIMRILYPFYRKMTDIDAETFSAFVFKTRVDTGIEDTDLKVFKIDYDSPDNPKLSIRPIVDELLQVDDGVYLGKVHFKWFGSWKMIAYFLLLPG